MKIAIVVGHNAKAQGVIRATDGVTEYGWNDRLAERIKSLNPAQVGLFRRLPSTSYGAEIRACYDLVDGWGADVSCELHLNSSVSPGANGTETLFATNAGKAVAVKVQPAVVAALGLRDRGLVHRPSGNGSLALLHGRAPAVLLESHFASNAGDCASADARVDLLARAILTGLGGFVPPPRPTTLEDRVAALEAAVARLEAA